MQPLHQQLALWQKQDAQTTQQERKTALKNGQENTVYSDFAYDMNPSESDMAANSSLH
jgi:hypothetical protein